MVWQATILIAATSAQILMEFIISFYPHVLGSSPSFVSTSADVGWLLLMVSSLKDLAFAIVLYLLHC